jgi:hypothetical protein
MRRALQLGVVRDMSMETVLAVLSLRPAGYAIPPPTVSQIKALPLERLLAIRRAMGESVSDHVRSAIKAARRRAKQCPPKLRALLDRRDASTGAPVPAYVQKEIAQFGGRVRACDVSRVRSREHDYEALQTVLRNAKGSACMSWVYSEEPRTVTELWEAYKASKSAVDKTVLDDAIFSAVRALGGEQSPHPRDIASAAAWSIRPPHRSQPNIHTFLIDTMVSMKYVDLLSAEKFGMRHDGDVAGNLLRKIGVYARKLQYGDIPRASRMKKDGRNRIALNRLMERRLMQSRQQMTFTEADMGMSTDTLNSVIFMQENGMNMPGIRGRMQRIWLMNRLPEDVCMSGYRADLGLDGRHGTRALEDMKNFLVTTLVRNVWRATRINNKVEAYKELRASMPAAEREELDRRERAGEATFPLLEKLVREERDAKNEETLVRHFGDEAQLRKIMNIYKIRSGDKSEKVATYSVLRRLLRHARCDRFVLFVYTTGHTFSIILNLSHPAGTKDAFLDSVLVLDTGYYPNTMTAGLLAVTLHQLFPAQRIVDIFSTTTHVQEEYTFIQEAEGDVMCQHWSTYLAHRITVHNDDPKTLFATIMAMTPMERKQLIMTFMNCVVKEVHALYLRGGR